MQQEQAEAVAIKALSFIASDAELLPRFLALTGIEAGQIRQAAREPGFLGGVLQFVLAHEPTLLRFSAESGIPPQDVATARRHLPLGEEGWDVQP